VGDGDALGVTECADQGCDKDEICLVHSAFTSRFNAIKDTLSCPLRTEVMLTSSQIRSAELQLHSALLNLNSLPTPRSRSISPPA
jgi:hypothetical protein